MAFNAHDTTPLDMQMVVVDGVQSHETAVKPGGNTAQWVAFKALLVA
jgi:hypothetical protein